MTIIQAAILGIVQGATEFLPVSSSGHLIIVPKLLGMQEQPLVFDTTMHLATALTLIVYFFNDYLTMLKEFLTDLVKNKRLFPESSAKPGLMLIVLSSIPAAVLGFLLDNTIENAFRNVWYVLVFMTLGTGLMYLAEKISKKNEGSLTLKKGLVVGLFQSLAIFPGVSRSGSTISGGMLVGMSRENAARFSFLISVPIVAAAAFFKILSTDWATSSLTFAELSVGFLCSFVTGIVAVKFLLNYLKNKNLMIFVFYRLLLAGFVLLILI